MVITGNETVWLSVSGIGKKEVLEGLGFEIEKSGLIKLNGSYVRSPDGESNLHYDEVKAVVPDSLVVISDISELEGLSETP